MKSDLICWGECIMIIIIADVLLTSLNDYCCCMDITGL